MITILPDGSGGGDNSGNTENLDALEREKENLCDWLHRWQNALEHGKDLIEMAESHISKLKLQLDSLEERKRVLTREKIN